MSYPAQTIIWTGWQWLLLTLPALGRYRQREEAYIDDLARQCVEHDGGVE